MWCQPLPQLQLLPVLLWVAFTASTAAADQLSELHHYDFGDVTAIVVFSGIAVVAFLVCVGVCVRRRRRAVLGY